MSTVVPKFATDRYKGEPPSRLVRERVSFVGHALVQGVTTFSGKLATISAFLVGSALTYLLFVADLSLPWIIVVVLGVLLIIFLVGAERAHNAMYRTALAYAPTWDHVRDRANTLKALTEEFRHDGSGGLLEPDQVDPQRRINFRRQYIDAHMAWAEDEFDRACAAGYPPAFDRYRIASAQLEDVMELVAAFEDVVRKWREDETKRTGVSDLLGREP